MVSDEEKTQNPHHGVDKRKGRGQGAQSLSLNSPDKTQAHV